MTISYNETQKHRSLLTDGNWGKKQQGDETKMEKDEKLNEMDIGVGTKESIALQPGIVEIKAVEIQEVGDKKNKKLSCTCKHPAKEETINISSVKFENKGKLESVGLWINLDEDKKIRKGSALAVFLMTTNCAKISELVGKSVNTTTDEKGYLTFKGY